MVKRLASEEEINLVVKTIVESVEKDSLGDFGFNYSKDDLIDDYLKIKSSCFCLTIETTNGYKIINVISIEDNNDIYETYNYTFIVFGEDRIYKYEGDFIEKNITESKYIDMQESENILAKLEQNVKMAEHLLLQTKFTIKDDDLIENYVNACQELNNYFDSLELI